MLTFDVDQFASMELDLEDDDPDADEHRDDHEADADGQGAVRPAGLDQLQTTNVRTPNQRATSMAVGRVSPSRSATSRKTPARTPGPAAIEHAVISWRTSAAGSARTEASAIENRPA